YGLNLTFPGGGESWHAGSQRNITWTSAGVDNVQLQYSTNNGASWPNITNSTPAASGSYLWTVPSTATTLGKIRIRSTALGANVWADTSDGNFTISMLSVTGIGGQNLVAGDAYNVTWSSANLSGHNVKL